MSIFDAGSIVGKLKLNTSGFAKGMIDAQTMSALAGPRMAGLITNPILGSLNIAKDAVKGLVSLISDTADRADKMAKLAAATGMDIEFLSGLPHAADIAGTSFGSIEKGLAILVRRMGEAQEGSGRMVRMFKEVGVSATDAKNQLRPTEQVFIEVAEGLKKMHNPTKRQQMALELLGRSATEMVPLLLQGGKGIRELTDEAKRLGLTFDQETGASVERFNDSLTHLDAMWRGLKSEFGEGIIKGLGLDFEDPGPGWDKLIDKVHKLGVELGKMASNLEKVTKAIDKAEGQTHPYRGDWGNTKLGLAAVLEAKSEEPWYSGGAAKFFRPKGGWIKRQWEAAGHEVPTGTLPKSPQRKRGLFEFEGDPKPIAREIGVAEKARQDIWMQEFKTEIRREYDRNLSSRALR